MQLYVKQYFALMKKLGLSAFLFVIGVAALYIADLLLVKYSNDEVLASWVILKSFMMLGGAVAMFGYPGLLVREPNSTSMILKIATPHLIVGSIILGFLGKAMGWVANPCTGIFLVLGYSFTTYGFQRLLATGRFSSAYLVNSLWRVFFFVGIVIGIINRNFEILKYLYLGFSMSAVSALFLIWFVPIKITVKSVNNEITSRSDVFKVGGTLFLASFSLAVSAYGESLIVNSLGDTLDVSLYYQGLIFFLFPGILFSQYIVAVLEPFIRNNKDTVTEQLKRYGAIRFVVILIIIATFLIWTGGWILQAIIVPPVKTPLDLSLILAATGALRIIYTVPSAYVGMVAKQGALLRVMIAYFISALCILPVAYLLHAFGVNAVLSVALASLINWSIRFSFAGSVIIKAPV